MVVTPSGRLTALRPLQLEKAPLPMPVTDDGMLTEVKLLQSEKA
jgi:hypothetical protein